MAESYFLPFEFPQKAASRLRRVWVAPVSSRQQELWGTLCAILQFPPSANTDHLFRQLTDLFTTLYYPTTISARTTQNISELARARTLQFEQMLQELNESFSNLERFGVDARHTKEFDVLLALIHPDELLLANHGTAHAWFVGAIGENPSEESRVEQLTTTADTEEFFSAVTSGVLGAGETIILATADFFSQWKSERVIHLIDTAESTEELLDVLERQGQDSGTGPHAALFILGLSPESDDREDKKRSNEKRSGSTAAIHSAAQATVLSLSPIVGSLVRALARSLRYLGSSIIQGGRWTIVHRGELPQMMQALGSKIQAGARWVIMALCWSWSLLRSALLLLGYGAALLIGHTAGKDAFAKQLELEPAMKTLHVVGLSKQRSTALQAIALSLVLLAVAGAGVITRIQYTRLKTIEQEQRQEIREKITQAQGPLIYGDDSTAKSLLEQARLLLRQLPDRANDPAKSQIQQELDELARQLRHEVMLPEPTVKISAIEGASVMAASPTTLAVVSPAVVAVFDVRDLARKRVPRIIKLPADRIQTLNHAEIIGSTLLLHDGSRVHRIALDGKTPMTTVTLPSTVGSIRTLFNNRLYAVDSSGRQLLKLNPAGSTWANPSVWFSDPTLTLPTAVTAIAVDGSVYLATHRDVVKYHQGKPEVFSTVIEPPLESPKHLKAPADLPHLLLLDNKRIIVLDKGWAKKERGGVTMAQLIDTNWSDVRDLVIDPKLKLLIVLADGNILQYPLPAIK